MTRPTHLHKPTGGAVFPGGYPANKIEPLPANYWQDFDRAEAFKALRAERDRRIKVCDYLIMPDYPLTEPQRTAWLLYRQLLRDLPGNTIDPTIPAWPVPPGGA